MPNSNSWLSSVEQIRGLRASLDAQGKKLVFTNGCFDLLHVGHVRYLRQARALGEALIVALNSDASVSALKGPTRPVNTQEDRAEILMALEFIDGVLVFDEPRVTKLIEEIKPHVYTKGGDYTVETLNPEERGALEKVGAKIEILPLVPGKSTTSTLKRVAAGESTPAKAGEPLRLGILGSGYGSNFEAIHNAIANGSLNAEISVVLSDAADSRILRKAREFNLPALHVDSGTNRNKLPDHAQKEICDHLKRHNVQVVVLTGFMRRVKDPLLSEFKDRIVNIHPSLLPKFKGRNAWVDALEEGEIETGCTVHLVNENIDDGLILAQEKVAIHLGDTDEQLLRRIQEKEHLLLPKVLSEWHERGLSPWADAESANDKLQNPRRAAIWRVVFCILPFVFPHSRPSSPPAMSFSFNLLNLPQREAVKTIHGPVLILAGAGTGKTRVVTMRIANMVDQGIDPGCLLSVTFTNKAANEMRERISEILGKAKAKQITMGTFHAFCLRLLREHAEAIGYKKTFTIYSGGEQQALIKKLLTRLLTKEEALDPGVALGAISKAKNSEIERERLGDPMKTLLGALYQLYTDEMRALNAMDFDDLLLNAVILLEEHPAVRAAAQEKYRFVMVDEFQDTNTLQMRMLRALVPPPYNICVVGDDDQSIYGWRGADITNINEFESFFPNPSIIKLEENYRSTTPILHTANSLIKNNVGRRVKTLWSQNPGQQPVRIVTTEDEKEEAKIIADEMIEMNAKADPWDDMAVLFRTNDQSRVLEQEFRKRKIPYRIVGARSFFDRADVKDIIAYLSVIQNSDDDVSLLRIINTPSRGIGEGTRELARTHSIEKRCSVFDALKSDSFQDMCSERARTAIQLFVDLIEDFSGRVGQLGVDYATIAEQLLEEINFTEHLRKGIKNEEDFATAEIGRKMLLDSMKSFDERKRPGQDLQAFLDEVSLNDDREEKDDITKKTGVCLITLHAAKGLEFPIVYLPGLEQGIIPHKRSIDEGRIDEERRLFYVGITRAMRKLTLSYARYRVKWGQKQTCMPSTFLRELDPKHIETFDHAAFMKEDLGVEEGLSYFQMLKKQLAEGG